MKILRITEEANAALDELVLQAKAKRADKRTKTDVASDILIKQAKKELKK